MIFKLAERLVDFQIKLGNLSDEDRIIYSYAYQLVLSRFFSLLLLLSISAAFGSMKEMLVFTAVFAVLRQYAGGLHLNSQELCILFSAFLIGGISILLKHMSPLRLMPFWTGTEPVSGVIIWAFSPVDSGNKRLSQEEKRRYSSRSRKIFAAGCLLFFIFTAAQQNLMAGSISAAHLITAAGMVMEMFHNVNLEQKKGVIFGIRRK